MNRTNFESVDQLKEYGFEGFVRVAHLMETGCSQIPLVKGVYSILWTEGENPVYLAKSIGGHFKGKDPSVPVEKLSPRWVTGTPVLYIGKAGNLDGKSTLRGRLSTYMQFGQGQPKAHWGGRYIWQIASSEKMIVCWLPTTNIDPRELEKQLIQDFTVKFGKQPFANISA